MFLYMATQILGWQRISENTDKMLKNDTTSSISSYFNRTSPQVQNDHILSIVTFAL